MFDPRQRMGRGMPPQGAPQGRPGWMQQLGQGLAAQGGPWGDQQPQGGPPPGVQFGGGGGQMPPQQVGPDGRPMAAPGGGFLSATDAAIRQALARRGGRPVGPGGVPAVPPQAMPVNAGPAEPDADQRGGPADGDMDDPRMRQGGGILGPGGYR